MIRLICENVERLVDTEAKALKLEEQGYTRLEGKEEAAAGTSLVAAHTACEGSQQELSDLSVAELRKMAKQSGIKGGGSLTKAELIEALENTPEE